MFLVLVGLTIRVNERVVVVISKADIYVVKSSPITGWVYVPVVHADESAFTP